MRPLSQKSLEKKEKGKIFLQSCEASSVWAHVSDSGLLVTKRTPARKKVWVGGMRKFTNNFSRKKDRETKRFRSKIHMEMVWNEKSQKPVGIPLKRTKGFGGSGCDGNFASFLVQGNRGE